MARAAALLIMLAHTATALSKGYAATSATTKGIVSSLTNLVNMQGGAKPDAAPRARAVASLSLDEVKRGLETDFKNEQHAAYLWSGKITPELYDDACVFTDPTLSFKGLDVFEANLRNLDPYIERFAPPQNRRVEFYGIEKVAEDALEAKWRMVGDLRLPWGPRLDLRGQTRYTLGGDGGRISSYDETWALSAGDALGQLLTPAKPEAPEFWAGRTAGAQPPAPKVVAPAGAPTIVILPGFGNDQIDYKTPLGLEEEVGLVAALERRGFGVKVVPVDRGDWLQVLTKGWSDLDFLVFEKGLYGSPAFSWYADKVSATVAGVDGPVLLLGHSAGGWLAKQAACGV